MTKNNDKNRAAENDESGADYQRTWGATREYKAEMADKLTPETDGDENSDENLAAVRAEEVGVNPSTGYPHPGPEGEGTATDEDSAK